MVIGAKYKNEKCIYVYIFFYPPTFTKLASYLPLQILLTSSNSHVFSCILRRPTRHYHTYTQYHWQGRQGVVEDNAKDAIWDAWPAHRDCCCKYLETQQIFLSFYIPNFQRLCLSLLLLISWLLHDYSSLFLFLALHFVVYLMDGRLIMGTGM